ncbi:MAG TPA: hypothetical protein VJ715_04920 [Pyrinomonadaceae bacterium]|nr:hypothetical protein [Pyrinomonadaceae bacterium]
MRLSLLCVSLLLLCSVAVGQEGRPRFEELVREFEYDAKAPLDVREVGRTSRDGVTVIDLTYSSPRGGRVPAYLVVPQGRGPFPVVLFGHWMMAGSPMANRREFLEEAVVMARAGAISLLIDAPLVRPGFVEDKDEVRAQVQSVEASRQQVIDFRRGIDLLTARRDVDPKRIAYVGHSYDAQVGGTLSAVEKRINSFVFMAGGFSDEEYVFDPENPAMQKLRERIGEETLRAFFRKYAYGDPVHFVGHSAPAAVFLQFGRKDEPIPEKWARRFYDLFAEPKKLAFYDAGHALDKAARLDRARWLAERLSLKKIDEAALNRIPDLK